MAGHSQFKNIMYRKGAQDAKKAKIFTKITREIITAVKTGIPDVNTNSRLRSAIQWARKENMPRDRIETAIKRGSGNVESDNFEPVRYEGYGPGGTAVIVQALTDNRNRTAADIRAAFNKFGGNMGETGSVSFMFDYAGIITYPLTAASDEKIFEIALEAGADNCETTETQHIISCGQEQFATLREQLEKSLGEPESAKLGWHPKNTVPVSDEHAQIIVKMMDMLEDNDDVQDVYSNVELSDSFVKSLSA
ncbi:MAG: YebC/PmpR family DNA-binding transcriptional regulator [Rickettsiales bacterium]|nr:YebC/PmpR family DNA-binding transcriptional regulator [Rickettsiales bacterium]